MAKRIKDDYGPPPPVPNWKWAKPMLGLPLDQGLSNILPEGQLFTYDPPEPPEPPSEVGEYDINYSFAFSTFDDP